MAAQVPLRVKSPRNALNLPDPPRSVLHLPDPPSRSVQPNLPTKPGADPGPRTQKTAARLTRAESAVELTDPTIGEVTIEGRRQDQIAQDIEATTGIRAYEIAKTIGIKPDTTPTSTWVSEVEEKLESGGVISPWEGPPPSTTSADSYSGPSAGPLSEPYDRRHRTIIVRGADFTGLDPLVKENVEVWAAPEEAEQMEAKANSAFHGRALAAAAGGLAGIGSGKQQFQSSKSSIENNSRGSASAVVAPAGGGVAASVRRYRNERGLLREMVVAKTLGGQLARDSQGRDLRVGAQSKVRIDVLGPNGEYVVVGGANKAGWTPQELNNAASRLGDLKRAASDDKRTAIAVFTGDTPIALIDKARKILGEDKVIVLESLGRAEVDVSFPGAQRNRP